MEKLVVLNDWQIPFHDKKSMLNVNAYISKCKPDKLILNGDILDFPYFTSKYRITPDKLQLVAKDRRTIREYLTFYRTTLPNTEIIYILGNHEQRFDDYIVDNAPSLFPLLADDYSFSSFIDANKLGVQVVAPYGEEYHYKTLVFTHGIYVGTGAARKEFDAQGSSGISGHTHHGKSLYISNAKGPHVWVENFCLCNLKGKNIPSGYKRAGVRDWQQGFTVIYYRGSIFNMYPIHITNHKFIAPDGELYDWF